MKFRVIVLVLFLGFSLQSVPAFGGNKLCEFMFSNGEDSYLIFGIRVFKVSKQVREAIHEFRSISSYFEREEYLIRFMSEYGDQINDRELRILLAQVVRPETKHYLIERFIVTQMRAIEFSRFVAWSNRLRSTSEYDTLLLSFTKIRQATLSRLQYRRLAELAKDNETHFQITMLNIRNWPKV